MVSEAQPWSVSGLAPSSSRDASSLPSSQRWAQAPRHRREPEPAYLCRKKPELTRSPMVPLPMPKKLRFNITPEIKNDIEKAKQNLSM